MKLICLGFVVFFTLQGCAVTESNYQKTALDETGPYSDRIVYRDLTNRHVPRPEEAQATHVVIANESGNVAVDSKVLVSANGEVTAVAVGEPIPLGKKPIHDAHQPQEYVAQKGTMLSSAIDQWSKHNGFHLTWNVKAENGDLMDWKLPSDIAFFDNYYNTVIKLLDAYDRHPDESRRVDFGYRFYSNKQLHVWLEGEIHE